MHRGYFIHARKMKDWVLRDNPNYFSVWCYLLEEASGVERKAYFGGKEVILKPGQLVTGRKKISKATGVSESATNRCLQKLKKLAQIETISNNKATLITVINWALYQPEVFEANNKRTTSEQQANNKRTLTEKVKESKRFIKPTIQDISDYCKERGNNIDPEVFFDHYEGGGWMRGKTKIKDWKACVRTWEKNKVQDSTTSSGPSLPEFTEHLK